MESDQVFEIEPSLQHANANQNTARANSLTKGHDAAIAVGGIDVAPAYEDTPLLARDGNTISGGSEDEDDTRQPGSDWTGADDFKDVPWWRKPSMYWLLPPLMLNALAFGAIIVPKYNLILNLVCNDYFADQATKIPGFTFVPVMLNSDHDPRCTKDTNVQALVAKFILATQLIPGLLSSITSPKLGALSDRYGRIKILMITSAGVMISELMTILAGRRPDIFSVNWILVGTVFEGLAGSFTTMMAMANAYASDITPPGGRGVKFGRIHGCLFTGIAIGPLIAATVVKAAGNVLIIFYAAIVANLVLFIHMGIFVPESVTKTRQLAARRRKEALSVATFIDEDVRWGNGWTRIFNIGPILRQSGITGLFTPLTILWPTGPNTSSALRRNLVVLASVDTIQFGVVMGSMSVVVLYTGHVFDWHTVETSYLVAIVNICRVFVLFVLLPTITRIVRGKLNIARPAKNTGSDRLDIILIWIALVFDITAYVGYSVAKAPALFIAAGCLTSIGSMGSPTLQSSLTKHVPPDRVGQILGAMGMLHGLARVVSPTIFNLVYAQTNGTFPQAVFVSLAAVYGLALLISFFIRPHVYITESPQQADDMQDAHLTTRR